MASIIIEEKDKNLLARKLLYKVLEKYCRTGTDIESLPAQKILKKAHPDIKFISKKEGKNSIGIDQIKEINRFVSYYPYEAEFKTVIIPNANELTTEAQNALLKILEEHSESTFFILGCNSRKNLLQTINSRCSLISINPEDIQSLEKLEISFIEDSPNTDISQNLNQLSLIEIDKIFSQKDINKRETALDLLKNTLVEEREKLNLFIIQKKNDSTLSTLEKIKLLQKLITMVERNTNPKLVVERFIIQYL